MTGSRARCAAPVEAPGRIGPVCLPDRSGAHRLHLDDGRVAAIEPADGDVRWLALPPFVNMHAHASRAFAAESIRPASLKEAIAHARGDASTATQAVYRARALKLFQRSLSHGTASIRSHTDVGGAAGMQALLGALQAASEVGDNLDVELVAFAASAADPADPQTRAALTEAADHGARLLGAVPAMYENPVASITALFDLTARLGLSVDLHLDEHLDPKASVLEAALDATTANGLEGRVTFSHACALSAMEEARARRLLERMAQARVMLIALPELNLFLQDRGGDWPRSRGIAPIALALDSGVDVRLGTDNLRDWFFPWGDADPFESAYLAALTAHVDAPAALARMVCGGRASLCAGDAADLVLVPSDSFDDALARRPAGRVLLRQGKVVSGLLSD